MESKDIIENNVLIAQFMGALRRKEWVAFTEESPTGIGVVMFKEIRYNTSWSWLMPVVGKIESLGYAVEIVESYCMIKKRDGVFCDIGGGDYTKLSATYEAVTRFVTIHGKQ